MATSRQVGRLGVRYGELAVGVPGALCIVASMVWLRAFAAGEPDYWSAYLPAALLLGLGISASLPMISTVVVRGVARDQLSLASASNRSFLQLGNAVGIALVVSELGDADASALGRYRVAWAVLAVLAAGCAFALAATGRRVRLPVSAG
jgi:hypothetical protein